MPRSLKWRHTVLTGEKATKLFEPFSLSVCQNILKHAKPFAMFLWRNLYPSDRNIIQITFLNDRLLCRQISSLFSWTDLVHCYCYRKKLFLSKFAAAQWKLCGHKKLSFTVLFLKLLKMGRTFLYSQTPTSAEAHYFQREPLESFIAPITSLQNLSDKGWEKLENEIEVATECVKFLDSKISSRCILSINLYSLH